jgi:hypothetical protein
MKNNLRSIFGFERLGTGAAFLALLACTSTSHADVILDNTTDNGFSNDGGQLSVDSYSVAQVFTTPSSDYELNSIYLSFGAASSGSANVYLYDVTGGVPSGSGTQIGTISGGPGNTLVSLTSTPTHSANTSYAVALGTGGGITWNETSTSVSGVAGAPNLGNEYVFYDGGWNHNGSSYLQMEVVAVPEVSITGAVMGFGVLVVALGRKFASAKCIA